MSFDLVKEVKSPLLKRAFQNFSKSNQDPFLEFIDRENYWIHKFSVYKLLIDNFGEQWWEWPEQFRDSDKVLALTTSELAESLDLDVKLIENELTFQKWLQYEFFDQWFKLKLYANQKNIKIIGDIPIFVSHRSEDVWSWKKGFQVQNDGRLKAEAGVPPDQFSETGQKWSMPTYCWDAHRKEGFSWWRKRVAKQFKFYDLVRLDHFIGFHHLFNIPPLDQTAENGKWLPTPGEEMLRHFHHDYLNSHDPKQTNSPFIAEDLGEITPEVNILRDMFKIPSMKVFQFGFWSDEPNDHHPESINKNCIYYTGTHDTSTLKGWLDQTKQSERSRIEKHFQCEFHKIDQFHFIQSLMQTEATIKIIPIQDLFFLDESHRFNRPGTEGKNWIWRINEELLYESKYEWNKLQSLNEEIHA